MPDRRNRPPTLKRAKRLRAEMTDAEKKLWFRIRLRQLGGHHFRRQVSIGACVVDFACLKQKLIIEVDGGQHDWRKEEDDSRTRILETRGYCVIRFWNNEVLQNIDGVLHVIARELGSAV
ncbi:endonuclease domain-containing protein [Dongia sp. agr-C8]